MNERMRELALASGFAHEVSTDKIWATDGFKEIMISSGLEKFAELIVQECSKLLTETDFNDIHGSPNAVAEIAADLLKDHFGVE
jgi:pyruvate carboxylase